MARRGDSPTRGEVTERVDKSESDMQEKTEEMDKTVSDIETVRDTLDSLDLSGTSEASDEVEQAIEGAEDVSEGEFEQESGELEGIQGETEEHEGELQERTDSSSQDLGKLSDASGRMNSDAANSELVKAKESALRDIDFLGDQAKRAQDSREESQRVHEDYKGRVAGGRRS